MTRAQMIGRYFLVRWFLCAFVVFATYNPSQYSFYHWIQNTDLDYLAIKGLFFVILFWVYISMLSIARAAMGLSGVYAAAIATALFLYGLMDIDHSSETVLGFLRYIQLVTLATALAVGLTWSKLRGGIIGQKSVRRLN